jgi:AcrR family transcriptional regulator
MPADPSIYSELQLVSRLKGGIMDVGLREEKKLETRAALLEAAHELFAERGFERVTVADVARRVGVSERTAFTYFPTKLSFVFRDGYSEDIALGIDLDERPAGESILAAFRRILLTRPVVSQSTADRREKLARLSRVIAASPTLQAKKREFDANTAEYLAALIAEEANAAVDGIVPTVAAEAIVAVDRALRALVLDKYLDGESTIEDVSEEYRAQANAALDTLEFGIGRGPTDELLCRRRTAESLHPLEVAGSASWRGCRS